MVAELRRLNLSLGYPDASFKSDGEKVKLTPEQRRRFIQEVGPKIKADITEYMKSPQYQQADDEERKTIIKSIIAEQRSDWRESYLETQAAKREAAKAKQEREKRRVLGGK